MIKFIKQSIKYCAVSSIFGSILLFGSFVTAEPPPKKEKKYRVHATHYSYPDRLKRKTFSGTVPKVNNTVAVSRSLKHYMGCRIDIPEYGYRKIEDLMAKSVKGHKIDIYVKTKREAIKKGLIKNIPIRIICQQ